MYERFIKKKTKEGVEKVYGPYRYHSIRDKEGKVKNIYVSSLKPGKINSAPEEIKPKRFGFLMKLKGKKPEGGQII